MTPARATCRSAALNRAIPQANAAGPKAVVVVLAALPLLDVILAQVQSRWDAQIGPLSLAQAWHGAVMACLACFMLSRLRQFPRADRGLLYAAALLACTVAMCQAFHLACHELELADLVADLQLFYWLVLWMTVLTVCRTADQCRIMLSGIAAGGLYAAASVVFFYLAGDPADSPYADISASAGGLSTAKGLAGILITGALAGAYVWKDRHALAAGTVIFCLAGLFLTYQRAGLAAMVLALGFLASWYVLKGRRRTDSQWIGRLLAAAAIAVVALVAIIGTSDLAERWSDLPDPDKAGSARISFWQVAMEIHSQLDAGQKVFGLGYSTLVESMDDFWGARIHTHSDWLDAVTMFGLAGLAAWAWLNLAVIRSIWRTQFNGPIFALSLAMYVVMFSQGLLTGQMFAPHVMGVYLSALACWSALARRQAVPSRSLSLAGQAPGGLAAREGLTA